MANVLYISYDGMTDSLGQSQVIPYLAGLSKKNYRITLLSFEKQERFDKNVSHISSLLEKSNIEWVPLAYTKKPPIISTMWDVWKMERKAVELHREKQFDIVHCRSYISSLVGLQLKKKLGVKFIFDMRAFYADERVDGKIWNLKNPLYGTVFDFFKRKEREFLREADYAITLTQKAKQIIHSWKIPNQPIPIEVIPCCSDLELFSRKNIDEKLLLQLKQQFNLSENNFVLSYLGSIGTWYMLDEMLDFFKVLLEKNPHAKFLFVTPDSPAHIFEKAKAKNISANSIIVTSAPREQVPTYLALSNWSMFFILPVFSKSGSSPTKQGEIMGMEIPHVCNTGVGDVDEIVNNSQSGILVKNFSNKAYRAAIEEMVNEKCDLKKIREGAFRYYSLEKGVEKYERVYRLLLSNEKQNA